MIRALEERNKHLEELLTEKEALSKGTPNMNLSKELENLQKRV